jgi:hypothetical protein
LAEGVDVSGGAEGGDGVGAAGVGVREDAIERAVAAEGDEGRREGRKRERFDAKGRREGRQGGVEAVDGGEGGVEEGGEVDVVVGEEGEGVGVDEALRDVVGVDGEEKRAHGGGANVDDDDGAAHAMLTSIDREN